MEIESCVNPFNLKFHKKQRIKCQQVSIDLHNKHSKKYPKLVIGEKICESCRLAIITKKVLTDFIKRKRGRKKVVTKSYEEGPSASAPSEIEINTPGSSFLTQQLDLQLNEELSNELPIQANIYPNLNAFANLHLPVNNKDDENISELSNDGEILANLSEDSSEFNDNDYDVE
jgi:hypothetical protein